MINIKFESLFSDDIKGFIEEKRSIGYKYQKGCKELKRFDKFVLENYHTETILTKEIVMEWTKKSPYEKDNTQYRRISLLRGLGKYMVAIGKEAYIYPKQQNKISRYQYTPYIFSEDEVQKLFTASDNYPSSQASPYIHLLIPCLMRLLYGSGLRISEALNLKIQDIDFDEGNIYIYNAKFKKERILPIAGSIINRLAEYSKIIVSYNYPNDWLFPSPLYDNHYNSSTIYKIFRKLLKTAGIPHTGEGPRLHDIRHTFAVHRLKKWVLENQDLNNCLPYLSIYMGHQDLRGTQHYLRLTSDMYPNLIYKLENLEPSIIPEVRYD